MKRLHKTAVGYVLCGTLYGLQLLPPTAFAQTDEAPSDEASLETVIVTATERSLSDARGEVALTPGGTDLIDMSELHERNVASLADALRYVPGIWAASDAGTDDMFFSSRGSNLDSTDWDMNGLKLLQDGLPVTAADGNNHNRVVDPLSARYAVVARGANAMKYGASTLGGAINFVSPTARTFPAAEVATSTGSHGQLRARASAGAVFDENGDALLTVEGKRWRGYRQHNSHRRTGAYANAGWRVSDALETRFYGAYLVNDQELPGALSRAEVATNPAQASEDALGGNYQRDVEIWRVASKTNWQISASRELEFGFSIEEQSLFHPIVDQIFVDPDGPGPMQPVEVFSLLIDTDHRNVGTTLRYRHELDNHNLLLGVDYGQSIEEGAHFRNLHGNRNGLSQHIDNDAALLEAFAMDRWRLRERTTAILAVQLVSAQREVRNIDAASGDLRNPRARYSSVNPRIGVIYSLPSGVDLFASVSRLFEPPTNFQLEDNAAGGDATLDAMKGTVVEIGTRGTRQLGARSEWSWDASLYHARVEDEILSVEDPGAPGTNLATNVDETIHAGVEAMISAALALDSTGNQTIEPRLSLTFNEFKFDQDPHYGDNHLPAAPMYVARGEVVYRSGTGFFLGPTFELVGERYADFHNSYSISSHRLWGLRGGWANDRWRVFAELRNVGDTTHIASHSVRTRAGADETILNPGEPRSAYLGFRFQLQ